MKKTMLVILLMIFTAVCFAQTGGYVKGKVTDTRSNPIGNVSVTLKELKQAIHTDSTGAYVFKNVPEGEYTLWFSHFSYIDTKRGKVNVVAERITNINMALLPFQEEKYIKNRSNSGLIPKKNNDNSLNSKSGPGQISGSIFDKFGNPLRFADIEVMETSQKVQSDTMGGYVLSNINPGVYTVSYSKPGFEERRFIGVNIKSNETTVKKVTLSFLN